MFKRGDMYWMRLTTPTGAQRRVSLGTRDLATAAKVETWVDTLLDRLDPNGVLDAVVAGEIGLDHAFILQEQGTVRFLREQREEARRSTMDWVVTDEHFELWANALRRKHVRERGVQTYLQQLKAVWPAPRTIGWFRDPKGIKRALRQLSCSDQTKSRYRAAVASFAAFAVEEDWLDTNPMPQVPGFAQSNIRTMWYRREDALKLLWALPPEQRAIEAVMWACGWEWSAIENATVGDFDLEKMTAFARGTKNANRQRLTVITEPEVVPMIKDVLASKLPAAKVWQIRDQTRVLKRHQQACKRLGLPITTLHDWRHTFAVKELQAGRSLHFVAQMLGHANTAMVQKVYGRFTISQQELETVAQQVKTGVTQLRTQSA